jgi:hypothetical protein
MIVLNWITSCYCFKEEKNTDLKVDLLDIISSKLVKEQNNLSEIYKTPKTNFKVGNEDDINLNVNKDIIYNNKYEKCKYKERNENSTKKENESSLINEMEKSFPKRNKVHFPQIKINKSIDKNKKIKEVRKTLMEDLF